MTLFVAGTWNDQGGKPSSYMEKLCSHLPVDLVFNGGYQDDLETTVLPHVKGHQVVYWFPDIPNHFPKSISRIKKIAPHCILIASKNNRDAQYKYIDLVARCLVSKINLLLEIREEDNIFSGSIIDPLGNLYCEHETDIGKLADYLNSRVHQLTRFHRMPSMRLEGNVEVPDQTHFFSMIRFYADTIQGLVPVTKRFFGNASFRCSFGFPSFRVENKIFVSRRNINKSCIDVTGFVPVIDDVTTCVKYYGEHKPSVDTPVQVMLYNALPNINYMIHTHSYIEGAPFTSSRIPCGAIEEVDEVLENLHFEVGGFRINLLGHGSLVGASKVEQLEGISFIARPFPERV